MYHKEASSTISTQEMEETPINMTVSKSSMSPSGDVEQQQMQIASAMTALLQNAMRSQSQSQSQSQQNFPSPFGFSYGQPDQLAVFEKLLAAQLPQAAAQQQLAPARAPGGSYTISNLLATDDSHSPKRRRLEAETPAQPQSPSQARHEHDDNNNGNRNGVNASSPSSSVASSPSSKMQELQEAVFRARLQSLAFQNEVRSVASERQSAFSPFAAMPGFASYPVSAAAAAAQLEQEAESARSANSGALNQLASELKKEFITKLTDFVDDLVTKIELHKPASPSANGEHSVKQEFLTALRSRLSTFGGPNEAPFAEESPFAKLQSHRNAQPSFLLPPQNAADAIRLATSQLPTFAPAPIDAVTAQLLQLAQSRDAFANISPAAADLFKVAQFPTMVRSSQQQLSMEDPIGVSKFMANAHAQLGGYLAAKRKRTKVTDTRIATRHCAAPQSTSSSNANSNAVNVNLRAKSTFGAAPFDLPTFYRNNHVQGSGNGGGFGVRSMQNGSTYGEQQSVNGNGSSQSSPNDRAYTGSAQKNDRFSPDGDAAADDSFSNSEDDKIAMMPSENADSCYQHPLEHTSVLTPLHLRKAKLMFFYSRYPSSSVLKAYFPDVKFNKNNTAQLVKWFSNFREFYYIQMEKFARQAIARGVRDAEELVVTTDGELYTILNMHYNRNNQIEVPEAFRAAVETTLREFFKAISISKDQEPSWKKAIYKVIARLDQQVPEYFKCPDWYNQLSGHSLNPVAISVSCA